jgi:hypothetical protein
MSTYIPKQIKPVRERVEAKLEQELIEELEEYCEYLDSDRDYVIAQALRVVFRKDKGFAEWRENYATRPADIDTPVEASVPKSRSLK